MMDPMEAVCANCRHASQTTGPLECWRGPPQVAAAPMLTQGAVLGTGGPGGQLRWLVKAFRPPVRPEETCGEFEPRPDLVN